MVFECKNPPRIEMPPAAAFLHIPSLHFIASKMGNGASAPKNKVGKRVVREVSLHIPIPFLVSASGVGAFVRRDIGKPK